MSEIGLKLSAAALAAFKVACFANFDVDFDFAAAAAAAAAVFGFAPAFGDRLVMLLLRRPLLSQVPQMRLTSH